ncbi:SPbeta prophage-derived aminoglycoside N(3')-acetyltransferase-like protein YokD [Cladobotryum mycophilum]|uniref:SPbeta prophage-derived aminoglycoside N(3')-acetyltransferase-like protein YokD n=1 Tax=Cladobotryum mycophilum TaxID=491253 RepID=A0ABR0SWA5_9HYPO
MSQPLQGPLCTPEFLIEAFTSILSNIPSNSSSPPTLLLHSSLRSIGFIPGSAPALISALLSALGPSGTLVAPTHTGDNSDPSEWSSPPVPPSWWQSIRDSTPAYDPQTTISRAMGIIPETLRTWPGALRSAHPQTSFAALGPNAELVTEEHDLNCRLGEASPLAKLESLNAWILLLGVGYDKCTAFHLAEYRLSNAPKTENSFAAMVDGDRKWVTVEDVAISDEGFEELGEGFEKNKTVIHGTVGGAKCALFALSDAVEYAQEWLAGRRSGHQ